MVLRLLLLVCGDYQEKEDSTRYPDGYLFPQKLIDEVRICLGLAFLNLFFYHFLPLLSTNLLILFRILLTIAENFEEVLLTIFITKNYPPHPVPLPQGERGK